MPVKTRRSKKNEAMKHYDELDLKIENLSARKKATMKRTFSKMRSNMLTKKERKRKEGLLKKKYGKFYKTYKQLEPRLTAHLANKIITISMDYDKAQNKLKRDLKKLKTHETKIYRKLQHLHKDRNQLENKLGAAQKVTAKSGVDPSDLCSYIGTVYNKLGDNSNKERDIMDQLMDIKNEIAGLESKID